MEVKIECIEGAEHGRVFRFQDDRILIGRSSRCDLCLDANQELGVSGRHCQIEIDEDAATLEDLGSTNGTLLSGKPVTGKVPLQDGATFRLGRQGPIFRFEFERASPPTRAEPVQPEIAIAGAPASPGHRNVSATVAAPGSRVWKLLFFASLMTLVGEMICLYWLRFIR